MSPVRIIGTVVYIGDLELLAIDKTPVWAASRDFTKENSLTGVLLGDIASIRPNLLYAVFLLGCFSKRSSMGMGHISIVTREQKYQYGNNTRSC